MIRQNSQLDEDGFALGNLGFLEIELFNKFSKKENFFESISCGMALVDTADQLIRVNEVFAKMLGYSCEELLNINCSEMSHPDDEEVTKKSIEELLTNKTFINQVEKRYRHKKGHYLWVNIIYTPVQNKQTGEIFFLGQIQDISRQYSTKEQIKIISQKYSQIINSLGEGVYATDLDDNCLFINPAALEIIGYTSFNFPYNKTMHELFHSSARKDSTDCDICNFSSLSGELKKGTETFVHKNGEEITIKYISTPLIEGDKIIGTVVIFRDDSSRLLAANSLRESESRFRALYNSTPSMLLSIAPNGNIIEVSDMWLEKMDYQRGFVRGNSVSKFVCEESQNEINNIFEMAQKEGRYHSIDLFLLTHKDIVIETDTEVIAEYNSNGVLERFLMVSVDVTEKRKTEQQLMQSQKMEAIGQLTGGIAHDFNNILQVIIGNLQILVRQQNENTSDKEKEKIDRVIKAADKARDLTKRLLAFSRRQVLETTSGNFNIQLLEFQTFLTRSLRDDITLKLHLSEDLWTCDFDLSQLENAILNLCVNSAGAMPSGGIITIETKNEVFEDKLSQFQGDVISGEFCSISIIDNGTGIDPDILPNIIEPFFTTKEKDKGTGLGLSMVYGFVEQTGGFMEITSELGKGSKITLYFPRSQSATASYQKIDTKVDHEITSGNDKTILLVEDNLDVQDVIVSILEEHNYKVHAFDEPVKAKAEVENGLKFDLLLTDVLMPGDFRGPDLADAIKKTIPDLKVLFLSGYTHDAFLGNRGLAEDEKFLSKPIDNNELLSVVHSLLS